jgi:hypothetical protein
MAGVYGDFLSAFQELFINVSFFYQSKTTDDKWGARTPDFQHNVILLDNKGQSFRRYAEVLDIQNGDFMYSYSNTPIKIGMCLRHPDDGAIYRITDKFDHGRVGGLCKWKIEKMTGDNGTQDGRLPFNRGEY